MMRSRMLCASVLLLVLTACRPEPEHRSFELQYLSPTDAQNLIGPFGEGVRAISVSENPPTLNVWGPVENLDRIAEVIQRFDRPTPNVQLRFQIIEADGFATTDSAIADVTAALGDLFRFRGYRLVADAVVQSQAPSEITQRVFLSGAGEWSGTPFVIDARLHRVYNTTTAKAVMLQVHLKPNSAALPPILGTTLTVPSGQTVVVGSAKLDPAANTLILVVRPTIQ